MRRWKIIVCMMLGVLLLLGCDEQAELDPIHFVDDSPVIGEWYLQAVGEDTPVAIDTTILIRFDEHGTAAYERSIEGVDDTQRYELAYNLTGTIISIDSAEAQPEPGVPRITGEIAIEDDGQTLRISTHTDEAWLLTREPNPGGPIEEARQIQQPVGGVDPMLVRTQLLAYATRQFVAREGRVPTDVFDLIGSGLVTPQELTASGRASDLPARYDRMTDQQRANWLAGNSVFEFFFQHAGTDQASSVVVCTLPQNGESRVFVGMANGAVHPKTAIQAAQLLQFQEGELPERWPDSAWSRDSTAGLEPLSD